MTIRLTTSADVDLDALRRVAWDGEAVEIAPDALARIEARRNEFETFVDVNAGVPLYGITTRHHYGAKTVLSTADRSDYHSRLTYAPPSVGPAMPDRFLRAVILARLATFLDGYGGVRAEVVVAIAQMLGRPLPYVPERGHGDPGEIMLLGHLFRELEAEFGVGGAMPLINGSPCAAAALGDVTLAARGRLTVAEEVLALSAEAIRAPLEHYDSILDGLWRDEYQAAALRRMRELLTGHTPQRRPYQAPVSFRNAPRMLGWLHRLQAQAEECAEVSLQTPSGNPVFVSPRERPPHGAVIHNGGYYNPLSAPLINGFSRAWADLAQLATHQVERLVEDPQGLMTVEAESRLTGLYMTQTGWAEEARQAGQGTLISLGGVGQTDSSTPDLLAWRLAGEAGRALDVTLTILATVATHTIHCNQREAPPALQHLSQTVLQHVPVGADAAAIATGVKTLNETLARRIAADVVSGSPNGSRGRAVASEGTLPSAFGELPVHAADSTERLG